MQILSLVACEKMIIRTLILAIAVLFLFACKNELVSDISIPEGAIPIVYCSYLFIPVSVDSVKGSFLIDTGAGNLHFDSIFFRENTFTYKNLKDVKVWGIGNSFQIATIIRDTVNFQFSNNIFKTRNVVVHTLKPIGGDIVDGLIGLKYFFQKTLEVNYLKQYIKIHDTIDSVDVSGYSMLPIEIIDGRLCIPIYIKANDSISLKGNFMIDMGSSLSTITSSVAYKFNFDSKIERKIAYYTKYGGVGGYSFGFDFIADSMKISNFSLKNVNMSYSSDTSGLMASDEFYGIIGNNILEKFDVLFDFTNSNLYLKPNQNFKVSFEFDRLGFTYVDRNRTMGGWIVTGLSKNSLAEKKGLLIDDIIVSVNKIPVSEISCQKFNDFFKRVDEAEFLIKRADQTLSIEFELAPLI